MREQFEQVCTAVELDQLNFPANNSKESNLRFINLLQSNSRDWSQEGLYTRALMLDWFLENFMRGLRTKINWELHTQLANIYHRMDANFQSLAQLPNYPVTKIYDCRRKAYNCIREAIHINPDNLHHKNYFLVVAKNFILHLRNLADQEYHMNNFSKALTCAASV